MAPDARVSWRAEPGRRPGWSGPLCCRQLEPLGSEARALVRSWLSSGRMGLGYFDARFGEGDSERLSPPPADLAGCGPPVLGTASVDGFHGAVNIRTPSALAVLRRLHMLITLLSC